MDESLLKAITQISGSVTGGVVGGFAGFIASIIQERAVRSEKRRSIASALIGEIGALTQLYREEYARHLTDLSSTTTSNYHPIRGDQEYMPIFRSLGSEIGHLPAPLPHDLVMWYTALTVALERAHALHDLTKHNSESDAAYLAKLAQDQIDDLSNLGRRSQDLITRLEAL